MEPRNKKALVIGGTILAERGYNVITCNVSGWRPNKTACEDMAEEVIEVCFDNVAFMARSEKGGDLPIRKFCNGEDHIEAELITASKERQYMYFKSCLPFFNLLEGRLVFFLMPIP